MDRGGRRGEEQWGVGQVTASLSHLSSSISDELGAAARHAHVHLIITNHPADYIYLAAAAAAAAADDDDIGCCK